MKIRYLLLSVFCVILALALTGCESLPDGIGTGSNKDTIQASGVIEAVQISVASELNGKVAQVFVQESDLVDAGDPLFELEDQLLITQLDQAQAQMESAAAQLKGAAAAERAARASLGAAETALEAAEIHFQGILAAALAIDSDQRVLDWNQNTPSQLDLPAWYFQKSELITAAEIELDQSWNAYQDEYDQFQDTLSDIDNEDFLNAEARLAEAWAAFEIAEALDDRQVGYRGREDIDDFIDTIYDQAESELEAAQKAYDQILADPEFEDVLEARARLSVAKERYDLSRDYLYSLYSGEYGFDVRAAETAVAQAEAGVVLAKAQIIQAENNRISAERALRLAEADLDLIHIQIEKLTITSPISGTVLNRTIDPGEILASGFTAITVGDLSQLSVTVYLPEDRYGQVQLGSEAMLSVDSFPERVFEARVLRIADEAEYTPRNVQTQEERQNTVYAVELSVENEEGLLKPGMPADVTFLP